MPASSTTWVVVYETADQRRSAEAVLVLTALEIEHSLTRLDGKWLLSVAADHAPRAGTELAAYDNERLAPRVGPQTIPELRTGWSGVLAFGG